ncbi:MAG TPA: ribosome maturation factor RimM [Alphaproteobacteria bacterium]|nr:ribosome maturation factor RimM [Alphaproteobacteria bacterium]
MNLGSSQDHPLICAAVIASAHGIRGHVKVKCFLEDPALFKTYSPFLNEIGEEVYKIEKVFSQNKDIFIVSLRGVADRNQAELLRSAKLMLPKERLPELSEDTFYHRELIGLSVRSLQGQLLGEVHALYNFGAGELIELKTLAGDLKMIPFTRETVPEIKLEEGTLLLSDAGEMFLKEEPDDI